MSDSEAYKERKRKRKWKHCMKMVLLFLGETVSCFADTIGYKIVVLGWRERQDSSAINELEPRGHQMRQTVK